MELKSHTHLSLTSCHRQHLGPVSNQEVTSGIKTQETKPKRLGPAAKAELRAIVSIRDFEVAASRRLPPRAFACMYSAWLMIPQLQDSDLSYV